VRSRPQAVVRVAQINPSAAAAPESLSNLSYLLQSVAALYPALEGADEVDQVNLQPPERGKTIKFDYDLLYLKYQVSRSPKLQQWEDQQQLQQYLETGGVLLVEASLEEKSIKELLALQQELKTAVNGLELAAHTVEDTELAAMRQDLQTQLEGVKADIDEKIRNLSLLSQEFAQQFGTSLTSLKQLDRNHPLRTKPFLFSALPSINAQPIEILVGGGIVFVIGNLSSAWGLDEELSFPRETLRTAQEMGINILHFAWCRRQMMQFL
jgi:hypothetical protein